MLSNWEVPSWMNHIYYHWSNTLLFKSHSEMPLEYCLFTDLSTALPESPNVHQRARNSLPSNESASLKNSWQFNSPTEYTWAKTPKISTTQFILKPAGLYDWCSSKSISFFCSTRPSNMNIQYMENVLSNLMKMPGCTITMIALPNNIRTCIRHSMT